MIEDGGKTGPVETKSTSSAAGQQTVRVPPNSATEAPDPLSGLRDRVIRGWMDSVRDAPMVVRTATFAAGTVAVLAVMLITLLAASKAGHAIAVFFVLVATLVVYVWFISRFRESEFEREWNWNIVRLPLPQLVLARLRDELETVRLCAFTCLHGDEPALANGHVRANIFFPDVRQAQQGVAFELRIPAQLRLMMDKADEWSLSLLPGEGATGEAFLKGQPIYADKYYGLDSRKKRQQIADDLENILTIPLKDAASEQVLAVLNIDVIKQSVSIESLQKAHLALEAGGQRDLLKPIIDELSVLPKAKLSIGMRRL